MDFAPTINRPSVAAFCSLVANSLHGRHHSAGTKSAEAHGQPLTDQRVTRGLIKQLIFGIGRAEETVRLSVHLNQPCQLNGALRTKSDQKQITSQHRTGEVLDILSAEAVRLTSRLGPHCCIDNCTHCGSQFSLKCPASDSVILILDTANVS